MTTHVVKCIPRETGPEEDSFVDDTLTNSLDSSALSPSFSLFPPSRPTSAAIFIKFQQHSNQSAPSWHKDQRYLLTEHHKLAFLNNTKRALTFQLPQPIAYFVDEQKLAEWLLLEEVLANRPKLTLNKDLSSSVQSGVVRRFAEALVSLHTLHCRVGEERVAAVLWKQPPIQDMFSPHCPEWHRISEISKFYQSPTHLAFIHGDYCLSNIIVSQDTEEIIGVIDWSGLEYGIRWRDVDSAVRSIARQFGAEFESIFWQFYTLGSPQDLAKYKKDVRFLSKQSN